jgi:hypothetical protein
LPSRLPITYSISTEWPVPVAAGAPALVAGRGWV